MWLLYTYSDFRNVKGSRKGKAWICGRIQPEPSLPQSDINDAGIYLINDDSYDAVARSVRQAAAGSGGLMVKNTRSHQF